MIFENGVYEREEVRVKKPIECEGKGCHSLTIDPITVFKCHNGGELLHKWAISLCPSCATTAKTCSHCGDKTEEGSIDHYGANEVLLCRFCYGIHCLTCPDGCHLCE